MKYGKHLAARTLELPEYSTAFIDYKGLKKLIKALSANGDPRQLQDNKAQFFFRVERELEKVNTFYLAKQGELQVRLAGLQEKRSGVLATTLLSKNRVLVAHLYANFQRLAADTARLEQFVELNETGFAKVLKKWDKRLKLHTKELFITTAVNVQPVFHRSEISELSDAVAGGLLELEAALDGESYSSAPVAAPVTSPPALQNDLDELFAEFLALSTLPQQVHVWVERVSKEENARQRLSKVFLHAVGRVGVSDETLAVVLGFQEDAEMGGTTPGAGYVDLTVTEDLHNETVLHACARMASGRVGIVRLALAAGVLPSIKDGSGRTPLHYAAEHGRADLLRAMLGADASAIDEIDLTSMTPLLYAVAARSVESVSLLLDHGATVVADSSLRYPPLGFACRYGQRAVLETLLPHVAGSEAAWKPDAEGLTPLHVVARKGFHGLVPVLVAAGADANAPDELQGWRPLWYAAAGGFLQTVQALLDAGADATLTDNHGHKAVYYAAMGGHLQLLELLRTVSGARAIPPELVAASLDIPDLQLPPPIIPLRRYGHNFLDKKSFVQLVFLPGHASVSLTSRSQPPGRLTLGSNLSEVVPRNVLLPVSEEANTVLFQLEPAQWDRFRIDVELFPTFGTRLTARTSSTSLTFALPFGHAVLPLFDVRLRCVGELRFSYRVVHPYAGLPLELSKFDPYWKSTSGDGAAVLPQMLSSEAVLAARNSTQAPLLFVTALLLTGRYTRIKIAMLGDGTPVVCPGKAITVSDVEVPLSSLNTARLEAIALARFNYPKLLADLSTSPELLVSVLPILYLPLATFLTWCAPGTLLEAEVCAASPSSHTLNACVDRILDAVFNHFRAQSPHSSPSLLVFTSANPLVCTLLNWKQPNFPVLFVMDGVVWNNGFVDAGNTDQLPSRSLREAVAFAVNNNLLGLVVPAPLLGVDRGLAQAVRQRGLILVAGGAADPDLGAGGVRDASELRFTDDIEV